MKSRTILYMQDWLRANGRNKTAPTDQWYLNFANTLLTQAMSSSPLLTKQTAEKQKEIALAGALYLHDVIGEIGGWWEFLRRYRGLYHRLLPFYKPTKAYLHDEINVEDIAFILWSLLSHQAESEEDTAEIADPYSDELLLSASQIYDRMDAVFEDAPICGLPSDSNWVMPLEALEKASTPLPETNKNAQLPIQTERALKYSNGNPLLFFENYDELARFFIQGLAWEDTPSGILPELKEERFFVVYANSKGILLAPGVAPLFAHPDNPFYNAQEAATKGYQICIQPGACPFDLIKYGIAEDLLPDVRFPFPQGKEVWTHDRDFVARFFLGEYYEGD